MGCYGIGTTRMMASIVEHFHDESGIIWPASVAPYEVVVLPVNHDDETQRCLAEKLYCDLQEDGNEVLLEDRSERPGVKFKDADLIGIPGQVIVGRLASEGRVEVRRRGGETRTVAVEDADSYNCFWHMPFRKSARVEVVNQSEKQINLLYYNIDWVKKERMSEDAPYFYAQYRQEYPAEKGKDYVLLETQGKGHYVGTVLSVRTRSPSWFGEGDEKIYIDGEKKASIWGTGTEDYFLSAWGLKTTSTPFFGVPYFDQWGIVGGHTSAYRWHVTDPLVFTKGIKVTFEHFGWISPDENPQYKSDSWNEREDDYSSVAFWYQTGEPTFDARAPHAMQRKLPNLDKIIAAREYTADDYHGMGETVAQNLDIYPDGHLFYKPQGPDDAWVEIPFEIEKKEPQRLLLVMTRSYDYGKYQAYLNSVKLGGVMDLYSSDISTREYHLLDFWPEPGKYKLRLECVGKNQLSGGDYLGIESVRLRQRRPRVSQYRHDIDKDWRKNPILYE